MEAQKGIENIDGQLAKHTALEGEFKKLKANLREVEKKDEMIAAARSQLSEDEAQRLILERFQRLLSGEFDGYLRQFQRAFVADVEKPLAEVRRYYEADSRRAGAGGGPTQQVLEGAWI